MQKAVQGKFSTSLLENMTRFRQEFQDSIDFVQREFAIGDTPAAILSMEGQIDKRLIAQAFYSPF